MNDRLDYDARILELVALEPNWDSYGASRITPAALAVASRFAGLLRWGFDLIPCSDGGVQFESHAEGFDLEIEFDPDGKVEGIYLRDGDRDEIEWERPT